MILISNVTTLHQGPSLPLLHTDDNIAGCGLSRGQLLRSRVLGTRLVKYLEIMTQYWRHTKLTWVLVVRVVSSSPVLSSLLSSSPCICKASSASPFKWHLFKWALKISIDNLISNLWWLFLCSSKGSSSIFQGRISPPRHFLCSLYV